MDQPRSSSGNGEDNVGIPDDLRCKRSDGKQWRCTAMSMPDKTVCEKHYIQAKKRAANSALRASLKKASRKSFGETDMYLDSKSDDLDIPLTNIKGVDHLHVSGKKFMEKVSKTHFRYSPETPPTRVSSASKANDDLHREIAEFDDNLSSLKTPPSSGLTPR